MQRFRRWMNAIVLGVLLFSILSHYLDAVAKSTAGFDALGMATVFACALAIWFGWTLPESEGRRPLREILTGLMIAAAGALMAYDDLQKGKTPMAVFDLAMIGGFGGTITLQGLRRLVRRPKLVAKKSEKKP